MEKIADLIKNKTYLSLEITPPKGGDFDSTLNQIENLGLQNRVDAFVITDNPLARLKYSSLFASIKTQNRFKKPAIATMSMRDRNKIALQSDLIAASDFGVEAILALTGDPATASDQPKAKGVFESNSNLLLQIIECLNSGIDYAGSPLSSKIAEICPFAVSNSYAKSYSSIQKKMSQKLRNGAAGIITQPLFGLEDAKRIVEVFEAAKEEVKQEIEKSPELILGFFPITKLRTAQFLASHVPGVNVPKEWMIALSKAKESSEEDEQKRGIELSFELFEKLLTLHPKIHLMSANKFHLIKSVIDNTSI
jgi:5,10-methylenetetrahydrofolate reductase